MPFTPDQVLYLNQDGVYGADELGLPFRDIMGEGVVGPGDFAVTQRGTPNMSVDVAPGACWVLGDDSDVQPAYRYREPAITNVAISAADATNPRKDLVIAEVLDASFSGVSYLGRIRVVEGTPGAVPAEPALPNTALKLAVVTVPAAAVSITNADIADARPRAAAGGGAAVAVSFCAIGHDGGVGINNTTNTIPSGLGEAYQSGGWVSDGTSITIPEDGVYEVVAGLIWAGNVNGTRGLDVRRNASLLWSDARYGTNSPPATNNLTVSFSATRGDVIDLQVFQSSGGVLNLNNVRLLVKRLS